MMSSVGFMSSGTVTARPDSASWSMIGSRSLPVAHCPTTTCRKSGARRISCEVAAVGSDEAAAAAGMIGARVKVTAPLKVYHVPRVAEVDISGMEGELKQYVALWKGKRISANLPFKVQFFVDVPGRGPVKFFTHLKEDEFEYL